MRGLEPAIRGIADGESVGDNSWLFVWADPEGMTGLKVTVNGETVRDLVRPGLWEKTIEYRLRGAELLSATTPGRGRTGRRSIVS